MYLDPITRLNVLDATHISFDINPQNVIALEPDIGKHYALTLEPVI